MLHIFFPEWEAIGSGEVIQVKKYLFFISTQKFGLNYFQRIIKKWTKADSSMKNQYGQLL